MYPSSSRCFERFHDYRMPSGVGRILCALVMVLLCLSAGRHCLAQSIQGSIIGTVQDKGGAVVPGATLTLENLDEGSIRTTTSNTSGDYQFLDAKAGHYS